MPNITSAHSATERVRDDIDPATTWVVSDTHFGHDNIVGFCHRPEDHEQVMIAEWRKEIPDDATVVHLGDLCYGHNGGNTRFRRLTAKELTGRRKFLIAGNHDNKAFSFYRDCGFKLARPFSIYYGGDSGSEALARAGFAMDPDNGFRVSLSHYPWNADEDGPMGPWDLRLHGHIHNNGYSRDAFVPFLRQHINISLEQTKYRPVNLKLLLDAALFGEYPKTTEEQIADARNKKAAIAALRASSSQER